MKIRITRSIRKLNEFDIIVGARKIAGKVVEAKRDGKGYPKNAVTTISDKDELNDWHLVIGHTCTVVR